MKLFITPNADQAGTANGIGQVVKAQFEYLPDYGFEFTDDPYEADIVAAHIHGMNLPFVDYMCFQVSRLTIYPTLDFLMQNIFAKSTSRYFPVAYKALISKTCVSLSLVFEPRSPIRVFPAFVLSSIFSLWVPERIWCQLQQERWLQL